MKEMNENIVFLRFVTGIFVIGSPESPCICLLIFFE